MDATNLYSPITPQYVINISALYTVHYFENHKNYFFAGERHNFWEMVYVDRGEMIVDNGPETDPIHLEQGDLLIYRPMEFHRHYSNSVSGHSIFIVSFQCTSPAMEYFFSHNRFHIQEDMRQPIGILLSEAQKSYSSRSIASSLLSVQREDQPVFGGEQILTMMLEWLLIRLIRNDSPPDSGAGRLSSGYVDNAIFFMKQNLRNHITLQDICEFTNISRSQLQKAFSQRMGTSVMHYLVQLRIDEAKFLICTGDKNFSEIAEEFCYSSVHHFSTQFRKTVGMSPTEYAESVMAASQASGKFPPVNIPLPLGTPGKAKAKPHR